MTIVLLTFTKIGLVGKLLIQSVRFSLASNEIAKIARSLSFILVLRLMFVRYFPQRKPLRRTKEPNILLLV